MLLRGWDHHQRYLASDKARLDPPQGPREAFLARLQSYDKGAPAGHRSLRNVQEVVDVFGLLMTVRIRTCAVWLLTAMQGDTQFTSEGWHKFFLRSVALVRPGSTKLTKPSKGEHLDITIEDVKREVPEPDNARLLAAAFAAISYSPLLLLYDLVQYGANAHLHGPKTMFEVRVGVSSARFADGVFCQQWVAAGNARRHELVFVPSMERGLWCLIFRAAIGQITVEDAVTTFFERVDERYIVYVKEDFWRATLRNRSHDLPSHARLTFCSFSGGSGPSQGSSARDLRRAGPMLGTRWRLATSCGSVE